VSFVMTVQTYNKDSAKDKAKLANDRRKQAQSWLRQQAEQKKPFKSDNVFPLSSATSGQQSFGSKNKFYLI
jgi:hypothetical protein